MIANNSSGARVPVYGTTADHVVSLEMVLADGRIKQVGAKHDSLGAERQMIAQLVQRHAAEIAEWMPPGLLKRWSGYGIERFLREPHDLTEIFSASEGTLGAICSAELNIVPLPREKGLGLVFFASVAEAMQATVELLPLRPAAIEHIDKPLFDQTKGQLHFQAARDLMELDTKPCEAILIVEFYGDVAERLVALSAMRLGLRTLICRNQAEMNLVWAVRKAGLSLLTGRVGPAKPLAFIEDAAVPPAQLPAYVAGLERIMNPMGLEVCYYGHAATGLLHVRPVLDLRTATDLAKYRQIADAVSQLVREFKGSLAAEHGVGIARTEYMREQVGDQLLGEMREIKRLFDPKNLFNPGKLIGDGQFRIDGHLRSTYTSHPALPFEPRLAFAFKDGSFTGNLEQCNGCGGCRKDVPTMCPTFLATGEEYMSTRGRANAIRAVLELRTAGEDPLRARELEEALSNCLSCKACTTECPSNVNLALLKAELLYARYRRDGLPLRERMLSKVDLLGRLGCLSPTRERRAAVPAAQRPHVEDARHFRQTPAPALCEATLRQMVRAANQISVSASASGERGRPARCFWRPPKTSGNCPPHSHSPALPASREARDAAGEAPALPGTGTSRRGHVVLWDDTFVRYHEPHIGIAAVKVLEALRFEVALPKNRRCCGRPAFSQGNLDEAEELGRHNLELLSSDTSGAPILFLEPSCYSMFVEDYRELHLPHFEAVAPRCFLFEKFVADLLDREPHALQFTKGPTQPVAIHAHCHAKSLVKPGFMATLARRLPGREVTLLDSGCCGMAGAFGALDSKYELSLKVAQPLLDRISEQPAGATVVASGTSCRHQLEHLTPLHPKHMAELLADALA